MVNDVGLGAAFDQVALGRMRGDYVAHGVGHTAGQRQRDPRCRGGGMPISSTHVALGAVFGVGFLREFIEQRLGRVVENVLANHQGQADFAQAEEVLRTFQNAPPEDKQRILSELKKMGRPCRGCRPCRQRCI